MPRARKATDDEVFAATFRAMQTLGPGDLTLAAIAAEAGITAGALVQRFGSKRDLLLAYAAAAAGDPPALFETLRAKHRLRVAAIRDYARCMATLAPSPAALARSLAYLQIDVTDEAFRVHLLAQYHATRVELLKLVKEAIDGGELNAKTSAPTLAFAIETAVSGALMTWAIYREGAAGDWLCKAVDTVLAPYLLRRSSKQTATRARGLRVAKISARAAVRARSKAFG